MDLLLLIMTSRKHIARQNIIRETWLRDWPFFLNYRFYVGSGEETLLKNTIALDCGDDYANLHEKQGLALQVANELFEFDYIFNCDDDTYVVVDRLLDCYQEIQKKGIDYTGYPCDLNGLYYAQGASGYFISKKAVQKFLKTPLSDPIYKLPNTPSDFLVGAILASKGIFLTPNYYFNMGKYITDENGTKGYPNVLPTKENRYISAHYCNKDIMDNLYDHFHGGKIDIKNSYLVRSEFTNILYRVFEEKGEFYISSEERRIGPFPSALEAEEAVIVHEAGSR